MHVPDGFIDGPTSLAAAAVAAGAVTVALRRAGSTLDDRVVPLAGLVSAFVFALQMLNFPVAGGTSGHLLGGALAAILVGPALAIVVMTVVLGVQALVFADGGLSALGVNIVLMGLVAVAVGHGVFTILVRVLPVGQRQIVAASAIAAWTSVVVASIAFSVIFSFGGTVEIPMATLTGAMVGVHVLVGVGEAIITAMTVAAIVAVRPDLIHAGSTRTAQVSPAVSSR